MTSAASGGSLHTETRRGKTNMELIKQLVNYDIVVHIYYRYSYLRRAQGLRTRFDQHCIVGCCYQQDKIRRCSYIPLCYPHSSCPWDPVQCGWRNGFIKKKKIFMFPFSKFVSVSTILSIAKFITYFLITYNWLLQV